MGLLIENCRLDGDKPGSVYSEGGRIVRVSGETTQSGVPEGTVTLDAKGGALFSGFADSHCHPFELGWLKRNVNLRGTGNITGLRMRLSAAVQKARPGEWVVGMGWDQEAFSEKRLPSRADIDDVSPRNPVALTRVCGHIALVNSRAIEALGLAGRQGPEYDRDGAGSLTGIVRERAQEEVYARMHGKDAATCLDDLLSVEFEAVKFGLTTLHCVVSTDSFKEELQALVARASEGPLPLRYRVYIPPEATGFVAENGLREKLVGDMVRINGVKLYADGSLGANTAALREPYSDDPSNSGILRYTDEELAGLVGKADAEGYQVIVHAIGDKAVEQAVGALSLVTGGGNKRRHRVEHASLLPSDLRSRMRKHGIRATVQPCFIVSDTWALQRLGAERVRDLYPFRSMLEDGIIASGSSDAPIETLSPVIGMWASMARAGQAPEQALTMRQALDLYTVNAASNGFDERQSGLAEGGRADFTILDSDVRGMHPAMFRKVGTAATVVDGRVVYSFEGA